MTVQLECSFGIFKNQTKWARSKGVYFLLISIPKVKRLNISLFTLFYFAFLPLYLLSHPSSPLSLPLRALIHLPPMLFQCSIFIKLQLGTLTITWVSLHQHIVTSLRHHQKNQMPFFHCLVQIVRDLRTKISIKQMETYLKRLVCESYLASGTYYI